MSKNLSNTNVLLGITGGIAAYKTPDLVRKLTERGADVQVVLTRSAEQFVAPLALQAVSGRPAHKHLMTAESESGMGHIDLARWADIVLIAPATANFIAQLRQGTGTDLLSTICLATTAKIAVAPAMNQQMWQNQVNLENIAALAKSGMTILGPDAGEQACGEVGPGRMLQPADLAEQLPSLIESAALRGKNVMITAGPTWEAIDPVRGITNHSSGKMGYALARAAADAGANVSLISGPTNLAPPDRVNTHPVTSAAQMHAAVMNSIEHQDIFIAVAAVADYRPVEEKESKIKKDANEMVITLTKNPDILADVAALKQRPFCVGFAAETDQVLHYAKSKLTKKKLDMIVANDVSVSGVGFGAEENLVTIMTAEQEIPLQQASKLNLARSIIDEIAQRIT
ncbi:MAG: bifunctional phosphopantothenoylcysteine decarboxylase/phosphopantothenate--cysteine ligase CoaBC [Pseudomonadota bacterium]